MGFFTRVERNQASASDRKDWKILDQILKLPDGTSISQVDNLPSNEGHHFYQELYVKRDGGDTLVTVVDCTQSVGYKDVANYQDLVKEYRFDSQHNLTAITRISSPETYLKTTEKFEGQEIDAKRAEAAIKDIQTAAKSIASSVNKHFFTKHVFNEEEEKLAKTSQLILGAARGDRFKPFSHSTPLNPALAKDRALQAEHYAKVDMLLGEPEKIDMFYDKNHSSGDGYTRFILKIEATETGKDVTISRSPSNDEPREGPAGMVPITKSETVFSFDNKGNLINIKSKTGDKENVPKNPITPADAKKAMSEIQRAFDDQLTHMEDQEKATKYLEKPDAVMKAAAKGRGR